MSATRKIAPIDHHTTNVVATPFGVAVEAAVDTKRSVGPRFAEPKARRDDRRRHSGAARLGNSANNVSEQGWRDVPLEWFDERDEILKDRGTNYRLFGEFDEFGHRPRVANCGRVMTSTVGGVVGKLSPVGVAHLSGYQTCGSIWGCPVCAAKIRQFRADQIADAVREGLARGMKAYMVTLTIPHHLGMPLEESFSLVSAAWRFCLQGRRGQEFKKAVGLVGFIRAFDLTHSFDNGWHPHLHALVFVESDKCARKLERQVMAHYRSRWDAFLEKEGYRTTSAQGVHVDPVKDEKGIGKYVSKVSFELTRSDKKKAKEGRFNQWQILRFARETGDVDYLRLWREYVEVSKGRKCITWSVGLKKLLVGVEEDDDLSDDEIAAQSTDDPILVMFGNLLANVIGNSIPMKIKMLRALEKNGGDGVRFALDEMGISVSCSWVMPARGDPPDGEPPPELEKSRIPHLELV